MYVWGQDKTDSNNENILNSIFPDSYNYHVILFELLAESVLPEETDFSCEFRVNAHTNEEVHKWIQDFQSMSHTSYNKPRSDTQWKGKKTI